MSDITRILSQIDSGNPLAARQLLPLVYDELRKLAAVRLANERPDHSLDATALVHEAYIRLVGDQQFDNRGHFFAAAAEAMRRILVESARRKKRLRHGGGVRRQELHADSVASPAPDIDLVALDEALCNLAGKYPVHARLVELRYFAGLSGDKAAEILRISPSTADRHWVFARAWLLREVAGNENFEKS